jgi:AcrR family transcriptional regulator
MNDRSPPPLRERMRALAATAILDAAEQVFAENGLQAGMDAIASRAGVAVGTIYNHYGDRESLIRALMAARADELLAAVDVAIDAGGELPFREQLRAVLVAITDAIEAHAAFRRVMFQTDVQPSHADRVAIGNALHAKLGEVLRRGHAEGLLAAEAADLQPALLIGLVHGATMLHLRDPGRLPRDRVADVILVQFLDGAGRRP